MKRKKPKDPCVKLCRIDRETGLCRGCWRTKAEIKGWKSMTGDEREDVLRAVALRREADAEAVPSLLALPDDVVSVEARRPREPLPARAAPALRRFRHRRSGGLYLELHRGLLEADLTPVVVYLDADGRVWVRPAAQFDDGRFEPA